MADGFTLYDVLGLRTKASQKDIEDAYKNQLRKALMNPENIPEAVLNALEVLRDPGERAVYDEFVRLASVRRSVGMFIPPADQSKLFTFCQKAQLLLSQDKLRDNVFHVRLQERPIDDAPVPAPAPQESAVPPALSKWRAFWLLARHYLLGGVFEGKTDFQKLAIASIYIAVIGGSAYGGWRAVKAKEELQLYRWQNSEAGRLAAVEAKRKSLSAEVKGQLAKVEPRLRSLRSDFAAFSDSFTTITGRSVQEWANHSVKPSRELDWAILRHPTVAEAWKAITAAPFSEAELRGIEQDVTAITARSEDPHAEDPDRLRAIDTWLAQNQSLLHHHRDDLEHIRTSLQADHYEGLNDSLKRSSQ